MSVRFLQNRLVPWSRGYCKASWGNRDLRKKVFMIFFYLDFTWVIRFSWPPRLPTWVPVTSHLGIGWKVTDMNFEWCGNRYLHVDGWVVTGCKKDSARQGHSNACEAAGILEVEEQGVAKPKAKEGGKGWCGKTRVWSHLEFGEGGLYWQSSWSPRTSQSLTFKIIHQ